jgi:hypothetical protein
MSCHAALFPERSGKHKHGRVLKLLIESTGQSLDTRASVLYKRGKFGSDTVPVGGRTGYRTSQQNASMTIDNYAREVDSRCVAIFGLIQYEWVGRVLQLLACVLRPACKLIGLC